MLLIRDLVVGRTLKSSAAGNSSLSPWSSSLPWLLVILLAGLLLRVGCLVLLKHVPESDELAYLSMASSLASGHGLVDFMGNKAHYSAGYPLLMLFPLVLVGGENLLTLRLGNVALGLLSVWLAYKVAGEAGVGRVGRLFAAAVVSLDVTSCVYVAYLAKENLMAPLVLGVMWCCLRLLKSGSLLVAASCGVLFGLLALVGSSALALLLCAIAALLLASASPSRRFASAIVLSAVTAIVVAPWLVRNAKEVGAPVLNTNGGFNLYIGNNPAATGWFVSIGDTPRGATWNELRKADELNAARTLQADALAWIQDNPAAFATLAVKKAGYFWTPPLHDGKGQSSTLEQIARLLAAVQFFVIAFLALLTLVSNSLWNRPAAILWIGVAAYTAVHMLFYVIFRYRVAIMPVVIVLAAMYLDFFVSNLLGVQRRDGEERKNDPESKASFPTRRWTGD